MMRRFLPVLILAGCAAPAAQLPPPEPVSADGLANVFRLTPGLYSGGSPAGEVGFRSLQKLGVKTVVTVDGAEPDVAVARRYGLRYVHLPIGYDDVPADRAAALAAAIRDLPGPVYVHCHHGKHRGPAAAMAAVRALHPECSAAAAVDFLKRAGTDPKYAGLFAAVERPPVPPAVSPDLPETAAVPDLVRQMVEIDHAWAKLTDAQKAGWADGWRPHAVLLHEHLREAARLTAARDEGFRAMLAEAEAAAERLEAADRSTALASYQASAAACAACHAAHRDRGTSR